MMKIILISFSLLLLLTGCNVGVSGIWKNQNIDKDEREQVKLLNDHLLKAIVQNDLASIRKLMANELLKKQQPEELEKLINQVHNSLKSENYALLDEYYVPNSTINVSAIISSDISADNAYSIKYLALNKEMYISLLLPSELSNEILIMAIYGKYDNEWRLNVLQFGQYDFFKKNAVDYYKLAKLSYDNSFLIDAVNYMTLAKYCLKPANDFFHYNKEEEIDTFNEQLTREVNSKFHLPLTLENIDTKPAIFNVYPQMTDDGFAPMVQYLSSISLQDTSTLKKENEKIKKEAARIFNGIDKGKSYVFYQAFNEVPNGKKTTKHFGFIDKLTK